MNKKIIESQDAPAAIGPYVQGVEVTLQPSQKLVFLSGQLGLIPNTGLLAEGIEAQTHQSLQNISAILAENDMDFNNIIKTTIFLKNLGDFTAVNQIYQSYFFVQFPARSCVEVSALPKNALVEIEVVAAN